MNCRSVREKIHDYLDFRLAGREVAELETHLADCPFCQQMREEFSAIQRMLSVRIRLPEPSSTYCLKRIRRRRFWSEPVAALRQLGRDSRSFLRDINPVSAMSRLAALPLTLCFFAVLIGQFPLLSLDGVKFPVLFMQGWTDSVEVHPISTKTFATRQGHTKFKALMETAWRLPYEDSFSLVAEITPEGHARIGGVLEYPKSDDLLNAADLALRSSRFVASDSSSRPQIIFSFQKIDVWEGYRYQRSVSPNIQ